MTTKEQVAAMAYSTGERLKSSAVELFRGLESSLQSREQLEVAFAKMFGSCTGDFKGSNRRQPSAPVSSTLSSSSFSDSPDQQHQSTTLGAAPLRRENSHTTSSSRRIKKKDKSSSSKASRKNSNKRDIGDSSSSGSSNASRRRERRQTRADYGEHIYAQLFMDDQKRAAQAVHTLRESAVARAPPTSTPVTPETMTTTPTKKKTMFPISSPPRQAEQPTKIAPLSSDHLHIPATLTFDDEISAISQHTLEAMEDRVNRTRSADSSLWSSLKESKTPPLPPTVRTPSPLTVSRVRSAQSKASRQSRTSHTTHTSDSSSFHNMWQKEEQRYWNTQVEQESSRKSSSRKSRSNSVCITAPTSRCWTIDPFLFCWVL